VSADLAGVITEARRAAGLSQAQLARRAGISPSYLSRIESAAWERGGPWPADAVLRALARALGISSTRLVALRRAARDRQVPPPPGRGGWRTPYAVSVGPEAVDAAARDLVVRNPHNGSLRSAQVLTLEADPDEPSYLDTLGSAMASRPDSILYRVCASDRRHVATARATVERLAGGRSPSGAVNVRTRVPFANPLVLDVLIGDNAVLFAVPDRSGHPHLRAGIVVDDPDFVAAVRDWFDESVWDPPCGYADVRGDGIDDPFAAIEDSLPGTADPRCRLKPLEAMGAGNPVTWST
jgi:transcriptional regulator with XRE-family HTH domain